MATGFPASTGDVLSAAMFNGLVAFTLNAQTGTTYTTVIADSYQTLITQSNASANAIKIPTNASVAHPVGTVITVLNIGAGLCTISAVTQVQPQSFQQVQRRLLLHLLNISQQHVLRLRLILGML